VLRDAFELGLVVLPVVSMPFRASLQALLWFAFQRLANREKKDGTLAFRVRRKEVSQVIVEEVSPVAPRRWAYVARYILPPMAPASNWTAR